MWYEVIVRTLMLAVLKAAPENLRENLLRAVGSGIKDQLASLDFGTASSLHHEQRGEWDNCFFIESDVMYCEVKIRWSCHPMKTYGMDIVSMFFTIQPQVREIIVSIQKSAIGNHFEPLRNRDLFASNKMEAFSHRSKT